MSFSPQEVINVEQPKDTRKGQKSHIYHDRDQNKNIGRIQIKVLITLSLLSSDTPPPTDGDCSGRYASCWNALLSFL